MRTVFVWTLVAAASALAGDEPSISLDTMTLAGSTRLIKSANGNGLRLTPAGMHMAGAAWLPDRQPVGSGFESTFRFQITESGGLGRGADGFAFVLQNSGPAAIGGKGSGGGFALGDDAAGNGSEGIPQSIAIFFDTFRNREIGDASNNFVTICTAGTPQDLHWPPPRLASSKTLSVNLKDRKDHTARISYQPPALTIYLDGKRVLASAVDLSTVIGSDGGAWIGFTASTGSGYENHDILSWSFTRPDVSSAMSATSSNISYLKAACLPDRNLCTPERAIVEELGAGAYHVVLPGNAAWGASIPNPTGHVVGVANARGSVCRDVASRGADGCVGPGALIQRTAGGRTSFWIDFPGDSTLNEGYLEFDARLQ